MLSLIDDEGVFYQVANHTGRGDLTGVINLNALQDRCQFLLLINNLSELINFYSPFF